VTGKAPVTYLGQDASLPGPHPSFPGGAHLQASLLEG
jgi:hypothetical protein